jgi:hypothetical protein
MKAMKNAKEKHERIPPKNEGAHIKYKIIQKVK